MEVEAVMTFLEQQARDVGDGEQIDKLPEAVLDKDFPKRPAEEVLEEGEGQKERARDRKPHEDVWQHTLASGAVRLHDRR